MYTIWPNGTHPQLIMRDASAPAWSDDGTRVFVQRDTCTTPGGCESSDEETNVVYSVATDGTDAHQVGDDDYDVSQPGWPPGQNVLAFLAQEGSVTPTGLPTSVDSSEATWSPDGDRARDRGRAEGDLGGERRRRATPRRQGGLQLAVLGDGAGVQVALGVYPARQLDPLCADRAGLAHRGRGRHGRGLGPDRRPARRVSRSPAPRRSRRGRARSRRSRGRSARAAG